MFVIFFTIFIILMFAVPIILIILVITKGLKSRNNHELKTEKEQMIQKVQSMVKNLSPWNNRELSEIINHLNYFNSRIILSKLTGYLMTYNNEHIIAFQRIEQVNGSDAQIVAQSTDFRIFYQLKNFEISIEYNDSYIGKILNFKHILNSNGEIIALLDRIDPAFRFEFISNGNLIPIGNKHEQRSYSVNFSSGKTLVLNKSFNNKAFQKNPFYRKNPITSYQKNITHTRQQYQSYPIINDEIYLDSEEHKWAMILAIYECIYYSYDFI